MDNLITLVNKLQRACTALGDHGEESALPTLWDSLPAIAVVGGQVPFFPSLARSFVLVLVGSGAVTQLRGGGSRGLLVEPRGLVVDAAWLCLDLQSLGAQEARFGSLTCLNLEQF